MKNNNTTERASTGKIARLPNDIREQINHRLLDGKSGPDILSWLNELPAVKEILAAKFAGAPVNQQNLTNWRRTGYRHWLVEQKNIGSLKSLGEYASNLAEAGGGNISRGAVAFASGKILKFLEQTSSENTTPEEIIKLAAAASNLLKGEQANIHLQLAEQRVRQRDQIILLTRDKLQRDDTAIALHVLNDARAKAIEACDADYAAKIEIMGRHLFGELWEPRPIPISGITSSPTQP